MKRSRTLIASAAVLVGAAATHLLDGFAEVSKEHHDLEGLTDAHASSIALPWIAIALLVIGVALLIRRLPQRLNLLSVALPFLVWAAQETVERLGGAEPLGFESNAVKHIGLGLLIQLPIALLIYLVVRVALVVVRKLVGSFPQPRRESDDDSQGVVGERRGFVPKISIVARGSPTRGPPVLVAI